MKGRVPSRRLTQLEYAYTIRDLFGIENDLADLLPAESDSGGFDTIGSDQRTSALHIKSYLQAADATLDAVFQLRDQPANSRQKVTCLTSPLFGVGKERINDAVQGSEAGFTMGAIVDRQPLMVKTMTV